MAGYITDDAADWPPFDGLRLTCEDDVLFSEHAIEEASEVLAGLQDEHGESTGPLLVYTSSVYQDRMEPGIKIIDSRSLCGSCAISFALRHRPNYHVQPSDDHMDTRDSIFVCDA